MTKGKTMDLTTGPVGKLLLRFAIPIILGNLLQQLYGAADRLVVGQFSENGATALAAIGATSAAIYLTVGLFIGIGTGINVICANLLGSKDMQALRKCMHTAVLAGIISGILLGTAGYFMTPVILSWMGTPLSVMPLAVTYMQLYFVGVPATILYNFGAGILRAFGDTKRPMYILIFSGLANVALNLVFVIGLRMSVAGVAIATAISQYLSAGAVMYILFSKKDQYRLGLRELSVDKKQLAAIVRMGIPSGLGSIVFSFSNVILQSSLNTFDSDAVIAANTIAVDINTLIYQIEGALSAACVSFAGQCFGAGNYKRIDKVTRTATGLCFILMGIPIVLCTVFMPQVVGLFNGDPEVLRYGIPLMIINVPCLFLYVPSEIFMGCSRGMKRAVAPTVLNMLSVCALRLLWVLFVFPAFRSVTVLYLCYPVSWTISSLTQMGFYFHTRRKMDRNLAKTE